MTMKQTKQQQSNYNYNNKNNTRARRSQSQATNNNVVFTTMLMMMMMMMMLLFLFSTVSSFTIHQLPSTIARQGKCKGKGKCNKAPVFLQANSSASSSSSSSSGGDSNSGGAGGYVPPEISEVKRSTKEPPYPKVGDMVRYYDLDGGDAQGQVMVGKITFIQRTSSSGTTATTTTTTTTTDDDDGKNKWLVEITEMEDVGDGYYTEYPSRKRSSKQTLRKLEDNIVPLIGSYVRTEDAYKVPINSKTGQPISNFESGYKLEGYNGPGAIPVNEVVVESDKSKYNSLKLQLLKDAAIAGLFGTVVTDLVKGLESAFIYAAGAIAGVGYLFFLSIKTDTVGSDDAKLGSNVSNLRFALPLLVLVGISVNNLTSGTGSIGSVDGGGGVTEMTLFRSVSTDQFAAAMLGFLTYRIPLFLSQLGPVVGETAGVSLPGSAGVALDMVRDAKNKDKNDTGSSSSSSMFDSDLTTILLVSGPSGTGKTKLVEQLIQEGEGKFVYPNRIDKVADPVTFEQLMSKNEILDIDSTGRYGLTKEGIFNTVTTGGKDDEDENDENKETKEQVVIIDADVGLSKKLATLSGARLVGVWIGLDSLEKFESRLRSQLENGEIPVPEDETPDSIVRSKARDIVKDIEYGVVSGIFEFTILNDDFDKSMIQLREAADYCFK